VDSTGFGTPEAFGMNLHQNARLSHQARSRKKKKSAALEADGAFYKYRTRGWRVKASMYCPSEYYLETFMIRQHKKLSKPGEK